MKTLLGDLKTKLGQENIFKPTTGNENLHQGSNDKGVRVLTFVISKNLFVKSTMFLHWNIHKYTWTPPDGKIHNQIDHILIGDCIEVYSMYILSGELPVIMITIWWLQKLWKQAAQNFDVKRFNLKKLSELEVRKKYQIKILNRFPGLKNLNDSKDINVAWKNIQENLS